MHAHQMFKAMPVELARSILQYFQENDRAVYRTALETMCQLRKLRPVFVQKKPKAEQAEWMRQTLQLTALDDIGVQLLQIWLLKGRSGMLIAFLDALGVPHDGKGAVDEVPADLDAEKMKAGIETLLAANPAAEVAVYLHMFQQQRTGGWPVLAGLLESDPRLKLGG